MVSILIVSMAQVSDIHDEFSSLYFVKEDGDENQDVTSMSEFIWRRSKSNSNVKAHGFSFYYARRIFDTGKFHIGTEDMSQPLARQYRSHSVGRAHLQPNKILLVCETDEDPSGKTRIYSARVLEHNSKLAKEFEGLEERYLLQSVKRDADHLVKLMRY